MAKRIVITIACIVVVVGILGGIKGLQIERMVAQGKQFSPPPEPVNTAVVRRDTWESVMKAVGSLEAVQGVMVTAELPGKVERIAFEPGTKVKSGDLLVQQDISAESAQLRAAEATLMLAKLERERKNKLLVQKTISRSEFDNAEAQFRQSLAQADNIRAIIKKKTIRAPFAGHLGIRLVNVGQVLKEGEAIVSLQSIDPVFVNFSLPQQRLAHIEPGLIIRVTTDALPSLAIEGNITAINPQVDSATRNIQIQATVSNPEEHLRPGMFVDVTVVLPVRQEVLAIPSTSILYAPYGDSVFVVEANNDDQGGQPGLVLRQIFVRLGEKKGDYIAVVSGLEEGQTVVSTGVFKLRNGQSVVVNNELAPEFKLEPNPIES